MRILNTLFLFLAFCSFGAIAQDVPVDELPTATLNESFFLTLNPEVPVSDYYYVDISDLDLTDEADFINKCKHCLNANLISTELHLSDNYLIVHIYTEFMGDMDYDAIQTYLNQLTKP